MASGESIGPRRAVHGGAAALSCPDRARHRDPAARGTLRLPARAGGQDRARHRAPSDVVRPASAGSSTSSSSSAGRCRRASGRTRSRRSPPGSAACGPSTATSGRVWRSTDRRIPGHWIVTFPWTGAERARAIADAALALTERNVSPARTARLTGSQARLLERWEARIDDASTTPPPWIRDVDRRIPIVSISGTNGKSTVTRLISHILVLAGRHVGTTTSDGVLVDERMVEPGDWTGPGGAHRILGPLGRRRRRARDGPRRDRPARRRLRVERREHPDQRQLGPPRPPGDPHPARAGRGQGDDLPDHPARRLGRPQRRRSARRRGRSSGPGPGSRCSRSMSEPRRRSAGRSPEAAGPTSSGAGRSSRSRAASRPRSSPVAEVPIAIGGIARHNVANALAAAGGARALGATIDQVADGLRDFRPTADRSPGRLNLFRLGSRIVIVDFAHNEAGIAAVLDVAEGIAGGAAGRAAPITVIIGTAGDRPDDTLRGIGRIAARARPAGRDQGDPGLPARADARGRRRRAAGRRSRPAVGRRTRSPSIRPRRPPCGPSSTAPAPTPRRAARGPTRPGSSS